MRLARSLWLAPRDHGSNDTISKRLSVANHAVKNYQWYSIQPGNNNTVMVILGVECGSCNETYTHMDEAGSWMPSSSMKCFKTYLSWSVSISGISSFARNGQPTVDLAGAGRRSVHSRSYAILLSPIQWRLQQFFFWGRGNGGETQVRESQASFSFTNL